MLMKQNPLVMPLLDILKQQRQPVSEHELITRLRAQLDGLSELAGAGQLALFQTHFLVMNALYQLQRDLLVDGFYLRISPLAVAIEPATHSGAKLLREASDQPLSEYYLDFSHFENADEQSVGQLLNSFWERYLAEDKQLEALRILNLEAEAEWPQILKRYRALAAQLHPDRGGDAQRFMQVREAFELLRRRYAV